MAMKSIQPKTNRTNGACTPSTGPLKATQAFGLTSKGHEHTLLRTSGSSCRSADHEPCVSHISVWPSTHDVRRSLSPDSPKFLRKVKKGLSLNGASGNANGSSGLHRSSSYDAVSSSCYLNGTWPRMGHSSQQHSPAATCDELTASDKETQTPKDWHYRTSPGSLFVPDLREIRARLKTTKETNGTSRFSPATPFIVNSVPLSLANRNSPASKSRRHGHSKHDLPHSRGSLEGLNQELETLDQQLSDSMLELARHDGRRAPVADLLSSDVGLPLLPATKPIVDNYTTFVDATDVSVISDSGFGSVHSPRPTASPTYSESDDTAEVSGLGSEKEEDTTVMDGFNLSPPKVTRMPPEGCESVICKLNESGHGVALSCEYLMDDSVIALVKPVAVKCRIPSAQSAFCPPLFRKYINQPTEMLFSKPTVAGNATRSVKTDATE